MPKIQTFVSKLMSMAFCPHAFTGFAQFAQNLFFAFTGKRMMGANVSQPLPELCLRVSGFKIHHNNFDARVGR